MNFITVFKTIKSQILIVALILVLLLLSQVFISRSNQATFANNLDLTQQAVVKVSLVRELERDVLDLQRNVLIYKNSASQSAIARFNSLIDSTQNNLNKVEQLTLNDPQVEVYQGYISTMRTHIANYQDNFSSVVTGRNKRSSLFDGSLIMDLDHIIERVSRQNTAVQDAFFLNVNQAKYHISRAENISLQYLLNPDFQFVEQFSDEFALARAVMSKDDVQADMYKDVIAELNTVEAEFIQLTSITSGYLFLVNVVMAGSANEFLFLARELNRLVTYKLNDTNQQVKKNIRNNQISSDVFSVFGILLAIFTALFLTHRIMLPINVITEVFKKLAKGEDVDAIPGITQQNEIGQLAKAADIFHAKNTQTTHLLSESRMLNARKEALNAELAESKHKAEQATLSKSMFLANMSHEIRTPMNGIIGMLDVVMKSDLTTKQRQQLNKVVYSSQILMSLINDILDFSKVEAGKLDIEQVEFSLNSVFANLLTNISARAQEKNLNVIFNCDPNIPSTLVGDPLRISQVLLNLSSNAIKFTRNGSVTINISYERHPGSDELTLNAEVIDTGIGMTKEQLDKVFDKFTQADGSTSRDFGGTGLGLSIVTQLVNLMGGEVKAQSQLHIGSNFNVSFKLRYQTETSCIFTIPKRPKHKLYYFSKGPQGLVSSQYLANIELEHHHFPLSQLETMLGEISPNDAVMIDVHDQVAHKALQPQLRSLHDSQIIVGFVTETQPSNLPELLSKEWPFSCLTHPYTPGQLITFVHALYNPLMGQSRSEAEHKHVQTEYEGHILLVEDNSINQIVAGEMLRVLGVTFDIAENGQQAVTKVVNSAHYDLVLMDVQMPIMDGYEATIEIRKQGLTTLVICGLSANAMKEDASKAKAAGMNEYLTKPLKLAALEQILSRYLPVKKVD
ncbi:MAG: signal transduction histidine kinase/CheY-like chemotaxis protein [Paraglaciecola sp.]|jgi:signal transduction histidine kinase/CheY-like chemotaxis protein